MSTQFSEESHSSFGRIKLFHQPQGFAQVPRLDGELCAIGRSNCSKDCSREFIIMFTDQTLVCMNEWFSEKSLRLGFE